MEHDAILASIPVFMVQTGSGTSAIYNTDNEVLFEGSHATADKKFNDMLTAEQIATLKLEAEINEDLFWESKIY